MENENQNRMEGLPSELMEGLRNPPRLEVRNKKNQAKDHLKELQRKKIQEKKNKYTEKVKKDI